MPETVWAIHNFEAEAEDEISFHIGEPIIIQQKDELYQDGWWEGTNVRGQTGLFPMNYTVPDPPNQQNQQSQPDSPTTNDSQSFHGNSNGNFNNHSNTHNNINNNHSNGNVNGSSGKFGANALANSVNNMHISQNPSISSPPMGGGRGAYGVASSPSQNGGSNSSNSKVIAQTVEDSLNEPQLSGHPTSWSIDQVAFWLRFCGFAQVVPSFVDNEISGAILLELNLNNLKELDINSFGKRFNIMNAITTLKRATKSDSGPKFGHSNSNGSMFGGGPNIPPRMASAGGPSPRASYDPRSEYGADPRHQDPRSAPMSPPASVQSPNMRHQQQMNDYDMHARNAALSRSDTMGSISGGSMGDARGAQRQSITSAYSSTSNPQRGQWDRNAPRPPQMPSPAMQHQQRGPVQEDPSFGGRLPMEQQPPMDQYPRSMSGPTSPDIMHDQFPQDDFQQQPQPQRRKAHVPNDTNRLQNGKADPTDKVVTLDMIGKPDYAGWLKKRGDTYRTWKSRWFMLKGVTLYYMNSPKENASKDYINLVGYKIIQDENIYAGKYCFKAVHEELRNFYFYTESEHDMKGWLKALMKVTIGRDPSAPVISSSNIPTIPLHVARRMAPRPPSPSRRNRGLGPNGQPMHPQQQQQQQQYDQKYQQQQQRQQGLPQHQQQQPHQQQLLDYDDQDSEGEEYLQNEYGPQGSHNSPNGHNNSNNNNHSNGHNANGMSGGYQNQNGNHHPESPVLQHLDVQRHSVGNSDGGRGQGNDDDPWRDEDDESFGAQQQQQQNNGNGKNNNQNNKSFRPDSELDSFHRHEEEPKDRNNGGAGGPWSPEQYVRWMNRNLPDSVGPVNDMTQSLRSGVVLVRLIETLSGEQVDKRIPNATYTLQMLENLLTAFKFMERVGISTDGYTVKDIFNGNEGKIVQMFESIRVRFPHDAPPAHAAGASNGNMNGNGLHQQQQQQLNSPPLQRLQPHHTGGSEYEALYDEAARSTIG
ncbi:polar growth protein [Gryganskiella cystojenkinii]|nr:polar growth protein [Gryganskiella cystojenkinii]